MRKVTTGIHGLDAQLGGGFPVGSTVALLAPPSNASQTFAVQFALGGLMTESDVLYANTDRPIEEIQEEMTKLEERAEGRPEVFEHLLPVDVFQERYDSVVHGRGMGKDLIRRVQNITTKERGGEYRIVVDSLSFFIERSGWSDVRDFLEHATLSTRRGDGVMLLSITEGLHDERVETYIKQVCDGWIQLGTHYEGLQATPFLKIGKMRGARLSNRVLPFEETDKGLWLETAARVF